MRSVPVVLALLSTLSAPVAFAAEPCPPPFRHTFYLDVDGDGFGDPASPLRACFERVGIVANDLDCDDTDARVYPSSEEVCDGVDNDCNGAVDEGAVDAPTWYGDADADGLGGGLLTVQACDAPAGFAATASDCDDMDPTVTCDDQVPITTCEELQYMSMDLEGAYFLANDIDCSATHDGSSIWDAAGFDPVGPFRGTLDGRGFVISDLSINRPSESSVGLFASLYGTADVRNLGLVDAAILGGSQTGGIAGYLRNEGDVDHPALTDVWLEGAVAGTSRTGGLVGESYDGGGIYHSWVDADVSGTAHTGGLVGYMWDGAENAIERSWVLGTVTGTAPVGGMLGYDKSVMIRDVYVDAAVQGTTQVGGLVGDCDEGLFWEFLYFTGTVTATAAGGTAAGLLGGGSPSGNPNRIATAFVGEAEITGDQAYIFAGGWYLHDGFYNFSLTYLDTLGLPLDNTGDLEATAVPLDQLQGESGSRWWTSHWNFHDVWQAREGAHPALR